MAAFRAVLFVLIAVFIGCVAWVAFSVLGARGPAEAAYGVPFSLVDQNGRTVTEAAFRGHPSALFFGYTHCPDVCPTTLFELDGWLKKVDPAGDRIRAYFITVDPQRDTPAVMKDYVTSVSKRIIGISGDPSAVAKMVKGFGIYVRKVPADTPGDPNDYTMDHTASVLLVDSAGRLRSTIAFDEQPETAEAKLRNLLDERAGVP
ncbi:MAG: SCO family protein [Pararhizobium sp.]